MKWFGVSKKKNEYSHITGVILKNIVKIIFS